MRQVHENLPNKNSLPHTILRSQKYTERIRFAPYCCQMVHTPKFYKVLYMWQLMCASMSEMSETQDRLQKRKERLQAICLQPDGHLGHLL